MKRFGCSVALLAITACAGSPEPDLDALAANPSRPAETSSLWNQDPESLFGNRRARDVGDLLTVLVAIDDEAEVLNDTQRNRLSERSFELPAYYGLPQWAEGRLPEGASLNPAIDLASEERFRGQGTLRRRDRLTLRLAARISEKLPNGDLVIEGRQEVQVGPDHRLLSVSGIVRPEDISRQNFIQHDRIAQADIRYVGNGPLNRTGRMGFGHRLLDLIVPF